MIIVSEVAGVRQVELWFESPAGSYTNNNFHLKNMLETMCGDRIIDAEGM